MNKCTLSKEINSCTYLSDNDICTKPVPYKCSMLEVIDKPKIQVTQNTYVRKERWYEKYYKGSK